MANEPVYARRILRHYFQLLAERSGRPFDGDCMAEIGAAVDDIFDAAVAESVSRLTERIDALEREMAVLRRAYPSLWEEEFDDPYSPLAL